ncbi:MAG: YihA family ribosome biogenesis GTP-binding protein [Chitinophagaceae bacterium]|nr:YihA family ribosome biogenesis GTP-binding protein [Chitinophagaceae bacterium]MBK8952345.1 YihA family ribosome biogenesis GTP-binding protein [Chitinophagaceae bacterium]
MEIISAQYLISSATHKQCPKADRPEYAFIGRSNVGKSSLINMLTDQTKLAKTSATPGKTQLINHFEIVSRTRNKSGKSTEQKWYIVDLPGYGYATVSQKARNNWGNMIESYIRKRENLGCLFVLIDSRLEPQKVDLDFIRQLGEWQVPFVIVFTKSDKNKPGGTKRRVEMFIAKLMDEWEEAPPYFVTSAVDRAGRPELLSYLSDLNSSFTNS